MRALFLSAGLGLLLLSQGALAGTVLIVGDSISAAFGLDTRVGWVSLLEQRLSKEDSTTRWSMRRSVATPVPGARRVCCALLAEHKPELVILELGGNDGLRGQQPAQLQQNLSSMIDSSRAAGAKVLLLGMQIPPNYGPRYTNAFKEVYSNLAEQKKSRLCPSFWKVWAECPN
ncbi:arylesterase [Pseudomonas amygdali pv. morsprunorum]|nr:arylesterase [Pseudomonas amygdali pv. morsprunorum]